MRRPSVAFISFPPLSIRIQPHASISRHFKTQQAPIDGLNGLPNFRDLATASPKVTPGLIYRGSTPALVPSDPDLEVIKFLHSIPTFLDLRSKDERISDDLQPVYQACGNDFHKREIHQPIMNKRKLVWGLMRVLPPEQARDLIVDIFQNPRDARKGVVSRLDQGGLLLLNKILVDAGSGAIGRALNNITNSIVQNTRTQRKVFFYCSAGKDRTGLLAALILKILDVNDQDIVTDYAKSSETWENGPYELRQNYSAKLEYQGVTPVNWLGAPPTVMEETLRYVVKKYGSIEDYLIRSGYPEHRMNLLRKALSQHG